MLNLAWVKHLLLVVLVYRTLTAQLLLSNGCRVLGLDPDTSQCDIAKSLGIDALCLSDDMICRLVP